MTAYRKDWPMSMSPQQKYVAKQKRRHLEDLARRKRDYKRERGRGFERPPVDEARVEAAVRRLRESAERPGDFELAQQMDVEFELAKLRDSQIAVTEATVRRSQESSKKAFAGKWEIKP